MSNGTDVHGNLASRSMQEWLRAHLVEVLLLVFVATIVGSFWAEIIQNSLDGPDPGPVSEEPEYFRYTGGGHNYDFFQYYAGGHNWVLGLDPYQNHPENTAAIPNPRHQDKAVSGFIYPPTWLPVFGLFGRMGYDVARHAWFGFNLVMFALLIGVATLTSRERRLKVLCACLLLTVCSYPFLYHVHQGQIDMIVAALSVGAFLLYPRWKGWPTALLLAVAITVKVTPAVMLVVMVVYFRDPKLLLRAAICLAGVVGASLIVVDPGLYREYALEVLPRISVSDPDRYNQTLMRFWSAWPTILKGISAAGYAALVFVAWVAGRNSRSFSEDVRPSDPQTERTAILVLTVTMTLMFSPLAWQMVYVTTIVPMALLLTSPPPKAGPLVVVALAISAGLMSMRIYDVQALNLLNALGAGIAALCVLLFYLPLSQAGLSSSPASSTSP